jgi:oligogalacturonide lyase
MTGSQMNKTKILLFFSVSLIFVFCGNHSEDEWTNEWECQVFPVEHEITIDPETGTKVIFVTSDTSKDVNFYFDLNCWFNDLSMMVFYSNRFSEYELFGYLPHTSEIVRLQNPQLSRAGSATADYQTNDLYVVRDNSICQWNVEIEISKDPNISSEVKIREHKITPAPGCASFFMGLTESADGKYLSTGLKYEGKEEQGIVAVDIQTGELKTLLSGWKKISHVQFSKYNPNLLRFSHSPHRMWYIDIRKPGVANKLHKQEPGELVTHEDWWVNDQMTFCGGYRDEHSHVKLIDLKTQTTRIIGAGTWWKEGTPFELSKYNWWHASGSRDGKWVATDNWHGHIALIDARNSHLRLLTTWHRPYGFVGIEHPHVGWAPDCKSVEFTSHKRGNPDVCIAYLPNEWNDPFVE